jgi:lysophospholipase L1-like esterase
VWDAGAGADQLRGALELVHAIARDHGASVVFVPAPPTTDASTDALLVDVTERARELAAEHPETAVLLDPAVVWGPAFDEDVDDDGVPERKRDGVHVCPSGAARFAAWLVASLAEHYSGVTPTPPAQWATGEWVTDARYDEPVGACAPL